MKPVTQPASPTDSLAIRNFRRVEGHPYLRGLADISVDGILIRGIKLEDTGRGRLEVSFPGRKIQGAWQILCQAESESVHQRLLSRLLTCYQAAQEAA